uniref:Midkine n=1 Tax=Oncorhynchus mykiss TaxID=8022 RepID=A0A8C7W582_ONCMY
MFFTYVMFCHDKCLPSLGGHRSESQRGGQAECPEKCFVKCVPNAGDFGDGFCEATCSKHTTKQCNIPCNWKKAFGADCKYRFTNWGECDTNTGTKSRSGTLKKDLFKLELPCSSRPKGKGGKGRSDLNRDR